MKEKQQSNMPICPFEKELISLIKEAIENNYSQRQTITLLQKHWNNYPPASLVETEDEIIFREKVTNFMNLKYEEFDEYSYRHRISGSNWFWSKTDELNKDTKRKFIYEVCCTIYTGFKMNNFNKTVSKKLTIKKIKMLFPEVKSPVLFYDLIVNQLLGYVYFYLIEENKKSEFESYLKNTGLQNDKYYYKVVKFIWMVENL